MQPGRSGPGVFQLRDTPRRWKEGVQTAPGLTPHGLETFLLNLGLFQLISTELPRFAGLPEVRALFWFLQSSVDMDLFPCEMIFFFMLSFVLYVS